MATFEAKERQALKQCRRCKEMYPATNVFFGNNKRLADGLQIYCKSCRVEQAQEYVAANRDKRAEYDRQYHIDNRDKKTEYHKQWYENNREHQREWRKKNKEKIARQAREWQKSNPDKLRVIQQRRRARKRNLPDTFTESQWSNCLEYFHYCCAVCGNQLRDLFGNVEPHADHWIPISYDGDDNPGTVATNIICLCGACNISKNDYMPMEWLEREYGSRKAAKLLERIESYFEQVGE